MSTTNIGAISVGLKADLSPFEAGMQRAAQMAAQAGVGIQSGLAKLDATAVQNTTKAVTGMGQAFQQAQVVAQPAIGAIAKGVDTLHAGAVAAAPAVEQMTQKLLKLAAAATTATGAFFASRAGINSVSDALASSKILDTVTSVYRVTRLILSPTLFTATSLAAGFLVEEMGKLAYAQGKVLEQQSRLAGFKGFTPVSIDSLELAAQKGTTGELLDLQKKATENKAAAGNLGVGFSNDPSIFLRDIAARLQAIKDPFDQAKAAATIFGDDAGKALQLLNSRFVENADRVKDWGVVYSEDARRNILQFKSDIDSISAPFNNLRDSIRTSLEESKRDLASFFAYAYSKIRDGSLIQGALEPFNLGDNIPGGLKRAGGSALSAFRGLDLIIGANQSAGGIVPVDFAGPDAQFARERERVLRNDPNLRKRLATTHDFAENAVPDQLTSDALNAVNKTETGVDQLKSKLDRLREKRSKIISAYFETGEDGSLRFKDDVSDISKAGATSYLGSINGTIEAVANQVTAAEKAKSATESAQKSTEAGNRLRAGRFQELLAEVQSSDAKRQAAGTDQGEETYAKAAAETTKVVAALNKELAEHNQQLSLGEKYYIRSIENTIAQNAAETEWRNKLTGVTSGLTNQIAAQTLLNAAVGKGAAALREANIELQLMQTLGEKYNDSAFRNANATDIAGLRGRIGASYDATRSLDSARNVESLSRETAATRALSEAQAAGAEAVRKVALENKLAQMTLEGATKAELDATRAQYEANRRNDNAAALSDLEQRIDATRRLTGVQLQGQAAIERAELENRIIEARRNGATDEQIAKMREQAAAERNLSIVSEAGRKLRGPADEVETLNEQLQVLNRLQISEGDTLALKKARKDIELQILEIENEQALAVGKASDGARAFFRELAQSGQSAARQVHDSFAAAFTGLNEELSKLMTGQKANWGSYLQGLGQQISKTALQNLEATAAQKLGDIFGGKSKNGSRQPWDEKIPGGDQGGIGGVFGKLGGIFGGTAKRDGSSQAAALFVQLAGVGPNIGQFGSGLNKPSLGGDAGLTSDDLSNLGDFNNSELAQLGGGTDSAAAGAVGAAGGVLKSIAGFIGSLFGGFRAEGGEVDPGQAYMVGEQGPELWTPPSKGSIIPNNKLGGTNIFYSIDARGTDPVLTEQRTKAAIVAAHQSAIVTATKVQAESAKRKPQ